MDKSEFILKRVRELSNIAYQRDIVTFTDFLSLDEQNTIRTMELRTQEIRTEFSGGYQHAERQMAAFHPDALNFTWNYPITCLYIEAKALKFSEALTHRDFLGALLHLGIERNVLGDIIVKDNCCWVFVQSKIRAFVIDNLTKVKHTYVTVTEVSDIASLPEPNLIPVTGTCSSIRLDSLIALAFQSSRSSMVSNIEGGLVFVNGKQILSNGYTPRPGDIISVRHKGRFLYEGTTHQTKKGRTGVRLLRYE